MSYCFFGNKKPNHRLKGRLKTILDNLVRAILNLFLFKK
jgi:hypothetical protein